MGDDNEYSREGEYDSRADESDAVSDDDALSTSSDDGDTSPRSGFIVDEDGQIEVIDPGQTYGQMHSEGGKSSSSPRRFWLREPSLWSGYLRLGTLVAGGAYLGFVLPDAFSGPVGLYDILFLAGIPLVLALLTLFRIWRLPTDSQVIECRDDGLVLPKGPDHSKVWELDYPELRAVVVMVRGSNELLMIETDSRRITYSSDALETGHGPEMLKREIMRRIRRHTQGDAILDRMQTLEEHARDATTNSTRVTYGILGMLVTFYAIEHLTGALDQTFGLVQLGANSAALIDGGQYFRLISGNFLHGNFVHILLNGIALFFLGMALERTLGSWRFLLVYLVSALGGAVASYVWTASPMSVGSSTAIFGLVGAFGVLHLKFWRELPPPYRQTVQWWGVILAINLGASLLPMVDGAAHFGGLVVGAAATFAILLPMQNFDPTRPPEWWLRVATGAFVLLFAAGLVRAGVYAAGQHPEDRTTLLEQTVRDATDDGGHQQLNQIAWMTATDPGASHGELDQAERAASEAIALAEGTPPQYQDTLATTRYRLGLKSSGDSRRETLAEAVSLEYEVLERGDEAASEGEWSFEDVFESERGVFRSQLARFLRSYLDEYGVYHVEQPWTSQSEFELQFGAESTLTADWERPPEQDTELGALVFDDQQLIGMVELCIPSQSEGGEVSIARTPPPTEDAGGVTSCLGPSKRSTSDLEPHVRPAMTDTNEDCRGQLRGTFWPMSPRVEGYP